MNRLDISCRIAFLCFTLCWACVFGDAADAQGGLLLSVDKTFHSGPGELCATIKLQTVNAGLGDASLRLTARPVEGGRNAVELSLKPLLLSKIGVPVGALPAGIYELKAELVSRSGSVLAGGSCRFHRITPLQDGVARFRIAKDGTPLLDGRPALLRTVWLGGEWEGPIEKEELKAISGQGFDSMVVGSVYMRTEALAHYAKYPEKGRGGVRQTRERCKFKDFSQFLEALHEYGMTCFAHMGEISMRFPELQPSNLEDAGDFILKYRDDPAILGWYSLDETDAWLETNRKAYAVIKEVDPHRPVWLNVIGTAEPNRNACDILSADPYPIGKSKVTMVSGSMDNVVKAVRGLEGKSPWIILQMFGSPSEGWPRPPTPQEERCMTYLALNHGAKGLGYFAHQRLDTIEKTKRLTPELWRSMKALNAETKELSLPYLIGEVLRGGKSERQALDIAARRYGGTTFIIAINTSADEFDGKIALDIPNAKVKAVVKFESREASIKDGVLTDRFRPYDVHVYAIE